MKAKSCGSGAFLGVSPAEEASMEGVKISTVHENSGAMEAGLQDGDIILSIDNEKMESFDDLSTAISSHKPGDAIEIIYKREGKALETTATL